MGLAVFILLAGGGYKFYTALHFADYVPLQPVLVAPVVVETVPLEVVTVGTTLPFQTVNIKSRITAPIVKTFFEDGALVQKGDPLFQLEDASLKAQLAKYKAEFLKNKAQLDFLKQQYERANKVFSSGYGLQRDVDSSKSDYEAQVALIAESQANMDNAATQLEYALIKAPITARAGTIFVTEGNVVDPQNGQALVVLNQVTPLQVQFSLPQSHFEKFRHALNEKTVFALIKTSENAHWTQAKISYFENTFDDNNQFQIQALLDNLEEAFWPGMYVEVLVHLSDQKDALTIPESAVQLGQNNSSYVYVLEKNMVHKRDIQVERFWQGKAVLQQGLKIDEVVVTDGISRLREGIAVQVSKP